MKEKNKYHIAGALKHTSVQSRATQEHVYTSRLTINFRQQTFFICQRINILMKSLTAVKYILINVFQYCKKKCCCQTVNVREISNI